MKKDIDYLQQSVDACLSVIQETTKCLHQEQQTSKTIASSIRKVESDLKTNEALMTSLKPHIIRYLRGKIDLCYAENIFLESFVTP